MDVIYSEIGRKLTFWMVARNWYPKGLAGIYIYMIILIVSVVGVIR